MTYSPDYYRDLIIEVAQRIARESVSMNEPWDPMHPNGQGSALVDHFDLKQLARYCREYNEAVTGEGERS